VPRDEDGDLAHDLVGKTDTGSEQGDLGQRRNNGLGFAQASPTVSTITDVFAERL
jgi:hypothetical protein